MAEHQYPGVITWPASFTYPGIWTAVDNDAGGERYVVLSPGGVTTFQHGPREPLFAPVPMQPPFRR